jgi:predicted ATPase
VLFVTGEGGIGKTTLVDRFLATVQRAASPWVARGQCLEQYGGGEAYLPVLEAVGCLARDDATGEVDRVLRRHAPTWVSQLPALDAQRTAHPAATASPARMLREMADALEVLTRDRPLVLLLEDLHWSDTSTIELVAYVARRRQPARLLLLGTFRSADIVAWDHPLRAVEQDLLAKRQCEELALPPLALADVQSYLAARFALASAERIRRLATRIHEWTSCSRRSPARGC